MLDPMFRALKEKLLIPSSRIIGRYIKPNTLSVFAFLAGAASALLIVLRHPYWALICWILNRILDGYDGTVARVTNHKTDFGGYLDILLDFAVYAMLPVIFTYVYTPDNFGWISLTVLLALFYINSASWMYLSAILEKQRAGAAETGEMTSITMPSGLIEGTETVIIFTLFYIFPHYLVWFFWTMSVTMVIGIVQRIAWANKHL
ncbi:MAG: CDP-alcohol phosphatidyltransferase family protein [Spirochaetia bacterium]|nr:CDP-alcohol phosphatidyltransferase family protein [Spirochaetia bacterium]